MCSGAPASPGDRTALRASSGADTGQAVVPCAGLLIAGNQAARAEGFRGIRRLAHRIGDRLVAGIVLCAGTPPLSFGDRIRAWPISTVWRIRGRRVSGEAVRLGDAVASGDAVRVR